MRIILLLLITIPQFLAAPDKCGTNGKCKPYQDCLPALNDLKMHGKYPENYCNNENEIVCCEEPNLSRISERKCLEYMDNLFEKRWVPPEDPEDEPELTKIGDCIQSSTPFIVNGNKTEPHEFPHMVLIGDNVAFKETKWFCGGFLISEKFVMTAAHCKSGEIEGKIIEPRLIRLGGHVISTPDNYTVDVPVKRPILVHPGYSSKTKQNDIALIELERNVEFNPKLRPACLPTMKEASAPPKFLIATGWGSTNFRGSESDILLKVELPHINAETCQNNFDDYLKQKRINYKLMPSQYCYGGSQGKDTCQGDSGGPLQGNSRSVYCSYTVYGITSVGIECGNNLPALYTNVASYLDWIEGNVWPNEN